MEQLPKSADFLFIIILLVPGFICIEIIKFLTPTRQFTAFNATIYSVLLSFIIHLNYSVYYYLLYKPQTHLLFQFLQGKTSFSNSLLFIIVIYFIGLLIFTFLLGVFIARLKNDKVFVKFAYEMGFEISEMPNLFHSALHNYEEKNIKPFLCIHFEMESYIGFVELSSFDLDKEDKKEVIISEPYYYKGETPTNFQEYEELSIPTIYLDLTSAKSIYFIDGDFLKFRQDED